MIGNLLVINKAATPDGKYHEKKYSEKEDLSKYIDLNNNNWSPPCFKCSVVCMFLIFCFWPAYGNTYIHLTGILSSAIKTFSIFMNFSRVWVCSC